MLMEIYSAALALALAAASPWWVLRMLTTQRYREGLSQRLGAVPAHLRTYIAGKRILWLHAVSVGEVLAASRLLAELETELGSRWRIVISTTTRTGQTLARERFGAARVFYMPLDFGWAVRAYIHALRPAMLILLESELWPRMLHECHSAEVPVAVVNARVSDRSFARAMKVRALWKRVLQGVTMWLAQSEEDAWRLVAMGVPAESVRVSGNLKYDVRASKENRIAELILQAAAGRPIIVAGSTLDGNPLSEDKMLIQAWEGSPRTRGTLLVLAPRHPEDFALTYSIAMQFPTLYATELLAGKTGAQAYCVSLPEGELALVEIIILDTIGDLAAVYAIADIAFVGGSLVPKGGHNPLEPAQFGVPIVMGPHFQNFRNIISAMQLAHAIKIVPDNKGLGIALTELLEDRPIAMAMGGRGQQVFEQQQGATARTVTALAATIRGEQE